MTDRLSLAVLNQVPPGVRRPSHTARSQAGPGIVHLGVGAFHRAHQAIYTDDALAAEGGDWRITGVSLRGTDIADALNPQDGLYTVLIPGSNGSSEARIIGSIAKVIAARRQPDSVLAALVAPATRIVSLTVTEKAYGIDRSSGQVLPDHPNIAPDLLAPTAPSGPVGLIVEALRRRRAAGSPAFTVLCCDNLPENGSLLRGGVLDFAARVDPGLRDWIATAVAFPSTMVDRITPSITDATLSLAERVTGLIDLAAIETEPFTQWVIEDRFSADRPAWDAGGALFVDDVSPYETMKLRMLNGSHSLIAYAGYVAGHRYVRDVMAQPTFAPLVARHLVAAASTLEPLPGIDLHVYGEDLQARFRNPAIAHETYQIAMDGSEKLPQRTLTPAAEVLARGGDIRPFAFAVAAWARYAHGRTDAGEVYELRDPRQEAIAEALRRAGAAPQAKVAELQALPGFFPTRLRESAVWSGTVATILDVMLQRGMAAAVGAELGRLAGENQQ